MMVHFFNSMTLSAVFMPQGLKSTAQHQEMLWNVQYSVCLSHLQRLPEQSHLSFWSCFFLPILSCAVSHPCVPTPKANDELLTPETNPAAFFSLGFLVIQVLPSRPQIHWIKVIDHSIGLANAEISSVLFKCEWECRGVLSLHEGHTELRKRKAHQISTLTYQLDQRGLAAEHRIHDPGPSLHKCT